jgi:hypothetical protein
MKILRPEVESSIVHGGGLYDLFDNLIKMLYNITDQEYNFILEIATEEEIEVFVSALGSMETSSTFSQRRRALELRNKMLIKFNKEK